MLQDTAAPVLITNAELAASLPPHTAQLVCLDTDADVLAAQPTTNPRSRTTGEDLAYLIYTSGSTGQPKGIGIPHRAITRLVCNTNYVQFTPEDRIGMVSNVSFDAATFELWGALIHGARLIGVPREVALSPQALAAHIRQHRIDKMFLTTALFNQVAREVPDAFAPMREIMFGGEAADPQAVAAVLAAGGRCRLLNGYGPTESTTFAAWYEVTQVPVGATSIPIGYPLANTQLYVLDRRMEPVPVGVAGELYIGGDGLAHGYLNRPALTAEKFVPDPFSRIPGSRLYRTGDLTRYLPNGAIDFVGRIDHQVKLRGYRIELGEIEAALSLHEAVRDAVVVVREETGDKRLVAYVVGEQTNKGTNEQANKEITMTPLLLPQPRRKPAEVRGKELGDEGLASTLRSYLQERLPEYMLPSAFVVLDVLPLTANGKIDRRALPVPDLAQLTDTEAFVAPRTPLEELIAGVWATVLGVERIGVHDNFFTLGGHSLLATQVVTRLRHLLGREVPLRLLFEAPTIAAFAAHVDQQTTTVSAPLLPAPTDQPLPLSFAQQRLWYLDQLQPNTASYTVPLVLRLRGPLQTVALQRSLTAIVARHAVLRTTFAYDPIHLGPEPVQQIAPAQTVPLPLIVLPHDTDEPAIRQLIQAEVEQPFDLQHGPLLRATLVRLNPEDQILVLVLHHSIVDGWSMGVLLQELTTQYRALAQGAAVDLPPLPIQYADYAHWQRQWVQGAVLDQQVNYWKQQLAAVPPLELPTDYPRTATLSDRAAAVPFAIPAHLSADLAALSQQTGATLFMTLLAAWQVLLARWSGQTDLAVGTPIAGRVRPELEGVIGLFVNTLVLRGNLSGRPSFVDLVARVRHTALEAYAHQDLPFEMVVEAVQPARDLSRHPLTQVLFALQNTPRATLDLPDLQVESVGVAALSTEFDLSVTLSETPSGLQGAIEYRAALFAPATIERLAASWQTLLAALVLDPHQPIDRLPLLSDVEQQHMRARALQPAAVAWEAGIVRRIAAQAAQRPDAIAVVLAEEQLTYAELDRRANQLAHHLQSLGVGPERFVGVCLPRTPDLVVALLAVLKAGGAYLPLDPSYPAERLQFMLADAQATVVLTEEALVSRLGAHTATVVCLDRDAALIRRRPVVAPPLRPGLDQLLYVIYTSGSTGTPKGVLVTERSLVNYLDAIRAHYTVDTSDRVLQFASISFDASVEELFVTLTNGATLVLRSDEMLSSPAAFADACAEQEVTLLSLPTAFWHLLAEATASDSFVLPSSVRQVIMGGEQAALTRLRQWQARYGDRVRLVNLYGPTETTIAATAEVVAAEIPADQPETTIGAALGNLRAYVLDAHGQLVPDGVAGELYLGGAGLARGYHDRPDLTATQFVPDPFGDTPGARLYRTGDRVRMWGDGRMLFLGRIDQQVKLRGYRIELGEIEAVLRQHPQVREAVAIVREDTPGVQQLVAYVVGEPGALWAHKEQKNKEQERHNDSTDSCSLFAVLGSALRAFVQQQLPSYMVPSAVVVLDALPMTGSDKLDRRALPAPETTALAADAAHVAPRDAWEEWLATVWAELLGRPSVGVTDNFFDLGGHSLLAVRLMAQIQQRLERTLPLVTLLHAPTIAQLAAALRAEVPAGAWTPLVPLQPVGRERPLFLVHPIGGTVLCYAELARRLGPEQPVYALQARGLEQGQLPHRTVAALATEYIAAIRQVQPHGPYRLGGWSFGGVVAWELARKLQQQGETVELLALIDSRPPLAEETPPDETALLGEFLQDLGGLFGTTLVLTAADLLPLPADERVARVLAQAQQQGVLPPDSDPAQLQRLAEVFAANLAALHAYQPAALDQAATLLVAEATTRLGDLAAEWQALTAAVQCQVAPGSHYSLLRQPHVQAVAEWLSEQLAAVQLTP